VAQLNVFVLGLDDLNLEALHELDCVGGCRFHHLLSVEELLESDELHVGELIEKASRQLDEFGGSVDAIVGYWDFPVSSMVPILCEQRDLPGPNLEAVVKCEHKYWSRLVQAEVIEECPRFGIVDLEGPEVPSGVRFPMWLKPVQGASSELAFKVEDQAEFEEAVEQIGEGIDRVGHAFEFVLDQVDLPAEIATVGGRACLAEEAVSGRQLTVEGYCYGGQARPYGVIDSVNYPDTTSFLRFQYPSRVPEPVAERLVDISKRVMEQIGLRWGTFNIEYFWDEDADQINLLEINPRHSQSHAFMFEYVDGLPHHQIMLELGLGREPRFKHAEGEYAVAAKWHLRRFEDGSVRRSPSAEEVAEVEEQIPGVKVSIVAEEGQRLSDLPHQDSYSFELADIHIGAHDEEELKAKYERCTQALRFEFDQ
jgi:ATP-grasp domain